MKRTWWIAAFLGAGVSGCGLGALLSAPRIVDADNDDVVFIGDSIFALSGEIQANLHVRNGGTFRNYTTSGAELTGGLINPSVEQQFELAVTDPPNSSIVVMDGGGNDILIPAVALFDPYDCKTQWYEFGRLSRSCKNFIDDIYVDAVDLLDEMSADGIDEVVYLGYYYPKAGLLGADDLDEAVDYGDMRLAQACNNSITSCAFVDPRGTIKNRDIVADGVHPSTSGSNKIADLIWPVLSPIL
ncbi:MAG: SGNH/GDSL hydrolase family protein [Deltaproteobacteria bacterium]